MYYHRQQQQTKSSSGQGATTSNNNNNTTDWYYRKLLGVPPPSDTSGRSNNNNTAALLSTKSVAVRQAYAKAVYHYQLERSSSHHKDGVMSEREIMSHVDALLDEAHAQEQTHAKVVAEQAKAWQQQQQQGTPKEYSAVERKNLKDVGATATTSSTTAAPRSDTINNNDDDDEEEKDWFATLQADPRTWQAMQRWSDRLHAIPYNQWTIGATTALDHWIAVTILGVSEDTWQAILQGDHDDDNEIGPAIVAVRQAVFPETILDARKLPLSQSDGTVHDGDDDNHMFDEDDLVNFQDDMDSNSKSVDDLLAALGALSDVSDNRGDGDDNTMGGTSDAPSTTTSPTDRLAVMTDELQEWRRQHQAGSLDETAFYGWTRRYMETAGIDKNALPTSSQEDFAKALLADAPLDRETSDAFWNALTTPEGTEALAADLASQPEMAAMAARFGIAAGTDVDSVAKALWNIAALRPLLDEYANDTVRDAFLAKYGDILLQDVPLEHLVVSNDKQDSIPASALPSSWASVLPATARVRLQMIAFRRNVDGDDLYALWKEHKAGRARYEEKLFRTKRLGIAYGSDVGLHDDEDDEL